MLFAQIICPPTVIKFEHLGQNFLINGLLLLLKYWNAHESRYHIFFKAYKLIALIIFILLSMNGSGLESFLFSDFEVAIYTWFGF